MDESSIDRFLITGASGMIGAAFSRGFKFSRKDLDVTNPALVKKKFAETNPSAIIHLANIDLRQCQKDPLLGLKTNVHATQHLIEAAQTLDVPLMFVSSGCIFNGPKGSAFDEGARPDPLNFYAEAKVISEEMILKQYPKGGIIVRTGWVFGGHGAHHLKFVDSVIEKCRNGETIKAGQGNDGSPTYVHDLVNEMIKLILNKKRGIFHVVNSGAATPWDIAIEVRNEIKSQAEIEPYIPSGDESKIGRSASEVLTSKYLRLRNWREAIREYVHLKIKKF